MKAMKALYASRQLYKHPTYKKSISTITKWHRFLIENGYSLKTRIELTNTTTAKMQKFNLPPV